MLTDSAVCSPRSSGFCLRGLPALVEYLPQPLLPDGGVDEKFLGQEKVGAGRTQVGEPLLIRIVHEQGDRRFAKSGQGADTAAKLDAVHAGKLDVEEQKIGL